MSELASESATQRDDTVVTMPKLGETVTEGTIGNLLKQVGDTVSFDDPLFEVSTDKVDSEIPSPADGVIVEILVASGDTVPVGAPILRIGAPGSALGPTGAARLPSAAHGVAAAGGPALGDAASPSMGGSEGMAGEDPGYSVPTGVVHDITMPKLGETVTEGTIGRWLKQAGDTVAFDDPLYEVSTDKVDSEIPSPYDGVLTEILVQEGETAPVGTVLARIGEPDAAPPAAPATPHASVGSGASLPAAPVPTAGNGRLLSPLVRRLAAENSIDLATVSGSGVVGRIRREDIERAIATASPSTPTVAAPPPTPVVPGPAPGGGPVPVTPAAPIAPTATAGPATPLGLRDEPVPLPKIRLIIADRTVHSLRIAPHVWTSVEVDLDAIERIRARHKDRFRREEGMSLTQLAFVARAVCDALRAFPNVNSSLDIDTETRILHHYVNLGIAVDLNEQGLVAPVIRDADTLNLRGLARAIRAVAQKATGGKLVPDDLTGSTFTITSPGPIADYASAPIINQPNSAILSLNMITRRPVAVGDVIAIHPMTILGFCYDHRSFDGVTASRFMAHVRDSLQGRDWEVEFA